MANLVTLLKKSLTKKVFCASDYMCYAPIHPFCHAPGT